MSEILRTMIVTAADVPLARAIADMYAGSAQNMWITGLSATGLEPATHYISSGIVPEGYQILAPWQTWQWKQESMETPGQWVKTDSYPGQPDTVYAACQQPKFNPDPEATPEPQVDCTLADIQGLFERSDITDQNPWVAMGRLGLQVIQTSENLYP